MARAPFHFMLPLSDFQGITRNKPIVWHLLQASRASVSITGAEQKTSWIFDVIKVLQIKVACYCFLQIISQGSLTFLKAEAYHFLQVTLIHNK